ncbi:hypothetical protein N399_12840 [Bacillus licheniformis CG-B52]|nr:hypothetical protein N399_12840 [Bacillus licheniformis CG-B52]KUL10908.1 hypothetical protein LI17339_13170 [Bacillus licheniformis LMG 17339]
MKRQYKPARPEKKEGHVLPFFVCENGVCSEINHFRVKRECRLFPTHIM